MHNSCAANDWRAFRRRVAPDDPGGGHDESIPHLQKDDSAGLQPDDLRTNVSQIPSVWTLESHCEWCIEDMIARGSVTLISAESGTGKTWLGYFLAGRVAHGREVLGRAVRRCRVLYLDGENPLTWSSSASLISAS
jgi:hypothetical protein